MKILTLLLALAANCCAQTAIVPTPASVAPTTSAAPSADVSGASGPEVSFHLERIGLAVPKYTVLVHEDGTGTYQAELAPVSNGNSGAGVQATAGPPVHSPIKISSSLTDTIFKSARALDRFNIECASKAKNIADTGKKTLSYKGPDGQGSCLYNYSENKSIAQLTETFQAIAFTMDEGRKLQFLHRFDRLGLYTELDVFQREVEGKRALEVGNIAPALRSIIADEDLMQKVRERAARLLAQSEETANR